MLFLACFARVSATAAKSRTNRKATKRLGRFAPNLAHMCKFIWEWVYAKQIAPRDTRRVLWGQQFKSLRSCPIANNFLFTSAESSGNGHRLNTSNPLIPQGGIVGGGRVSQIQKSGESVKRLDRLAPNLAHIGRSIWEWIYAKHISPRDTRGHFGRGV